MGIETVNPGFIPDCSRCSFVPMKTRYNQYEKAINELHEAKMKLVNVKVKETATDLILVTGMITAFVLAVLIATPFF